MSAVSASADPHSAGAAPAVRRVAPPPRARIHASIPAEEQLLLLSAGGPRNDDAIRETAAGAVNWQRLLGLAQLERAVPVIYPRFRAVVPDLVPGDTMDQLRRLALVSDFALLHLEARLRESLHALERAGVPVMLLKGAALAHSAYDGIRQRPMSDIDVLVHPSDAQTARRVMLASGWREIVGGIPESVYERHHHLPPLYDARSPELQLEIHTALFPEWQPFAFDAAHLWARALPSGRMLPGVVVPDPMHSLLHACLHYFWSHQARFGTWRTFRDVDAIASSNRVDWSEFVDTARAVRGGTSCYWTLRMGQVAAGIAVPASVLDRLRPRRPASLLRAIERHFLRNLFPVRSACPSVKLEHLLWESAVLPEASGHGAVRPWDEDAKFVAEGAVPDAQRAVASPDGIRKFLAFPHYVASLLWPRL